MDSVRHSKKNRSRIVKRYVLLFSIAVALGVLIFFLTSRNTDTYTPPLMPVEIVQPQIRTIQQTITQFAHIEARDTIPVVPLVMGTITDYPVKAGTVVQEGDILAIIDKAPFEQQVLQARAAYESYNSSFNRVEQLYNANAATLQDFETIRAQRDSARAQLQLAELQLGYAEVKSPITGTVLSAPTSKGNIGHTEQPIAIVADLANLVVKLDVSEKYFTLFTQNKEKLFAYVKNTDGDANITRALVDSMSPYIQAQTKTFEVTFKLEEQAHSYNPGMFVEVDIVYDEYNDVFSLPLSVLKIDKSFYTFLQDENNAQENTMEGLVTWHNNSITVSDNNYFVVPPELQSEYFVISGQSTIFDGQRVRASIVQTIGQ